MIKHIVMWKIKEVAEGLTKEKIAEKIKRDAEVLKDKIKEIRELEIGINVKPSEAAYDVVLYSTFDTMEDLDRYQTHPEHVKVAEFIGKVREARVVVDYEVE